MAEAGWPPENALAASADREHYPLMATDITPSKATFIRRHDPARVLREVDAKRKILALHACEFVRVQQPGVRYQCSGCSQEWWPCQTLKALAAVWCDHPDYDPAWKACTRDDESLQRLLEISLRPVCD